MADFLYPNAFKVPIWVRCSSTIRVIVVRLISAATRKNIIGKTFPMFFSRSALSPKSEYSGRSLRSVMIHSGVSISSTSFWASSIFCWASAILSSASFLPS
jgi:hypothetical protein